MEQMISFRCSSCGRPLKVRAEKAGRRARCKCGAEVQIPLSDLPPPANEETIPLSAAKPPPRLALDETASSPRMAPEDEVTKPPPSPAALAADEDENDDGTYGLTESFDKPAPKEEEEEEDEDEDEDEDEEKDEEDEDDEAPAGETEEGRKQREAEKEAMRARRKRLVSTRKAPVDPEPWRRVQKGVVFLGIAMACGVAALVVQRLLIVIGSQTPSEYAFPASNELVWADDPPIANEGRALDRPDFLVALVIRSNLLTLGKVVLFVALFLVFVELSLLVAGFLISRSVPQEYGARGLTLAGVILAGVNFLLVVLFQLLPLTTLIRYVIIPYFSPEVSLLDANGDRFEPIAITWSSAPYLEFFLALIFQTTLLAQPVLLACFLRAISQTLKIESLQENAESLIRLGGSTAFVWVAYVLLTTTGTSEVLLMVMRAVYLFGTVFLLGELIWLSIILIRSRTAIEKVLKVGWVA